MSRSRVGTTVVLPTFGENIALSMLQVYLPDLLTCASVHVHLRTETRSCCRASSTLATLMFDAYCCTVVMPVPLSCLCNSLRVVLNVHVICHDKLRVSFLFSLERVLENSVQLQYSYYSNPVLHQMAITRFFTR